MAQISWGGFLPDSISSQSTRPGQQLQPQSSRLRPHLVLRPWGCCCRCVVLCVLCSTEYGVPRIDIQVPHHSCICGQLPMPRLYQTTSSCNLTGTGTVLTGSALSTVKPCNTGTPLACYYGQDAAILEQQGKILLVIPDK